MAPWIPALGFVPAGMTSEKWYVRLARAPHRPVRPLPGGRDAAGVGRAVHLALPQAGAVLARGAVLRLDRRRAVRDLALPADRLVRRPARGLDARAALCRARHAARTGRGADPDRAADPQHLERYRHEPDPGAADHQHGPLAHASLHARPFAELFP